MKLTEKYKKDLDLIRQNITLLENYRFEKADSKHFERLRLNIAIYNDLKQSDFEIVNFLFNEEKEWRKHGEDGSEENLYFCAFVLTLFDTPEIVWQFFKTKNIDFDSSIGFDGEHLVSAGIERTYKYLDSVNHPNKQQLLEYIGATIEDCKYSQEEIDNWKEFKKEYFHSYKYPIQDELYFLYSTNEKELFLEKFPTWINSQDNWTYDNLGLYRTYAKFAEDKSMQIEATKLSIEKNDKDFLSSSYKRELAELYIDNSENKKAFEVLTEIIEGTNNTNIIRDCLEQLCRIVFTDKAISSQITVKAYETIKSEQNKYSNFSPHVDKLIKKTDEIFEREKNISDNNDSTKAEKDESNFWSKLKKWRS